MYLSLSTLATHRNEEDVLINVSPSYMYTVLYLYFVFLFIGKWTAKHRTHTVLFSAGQLWECVGWAPTIAIRHEAYSSSSSDSGSSSLMRVS